MNSSQSPSPWQRSLFRERFEALQEQYLLLTEQYEGWKQSGLPGEVLLPLLKRTTQDIRAFRNQLTQFKKDFPPPSHR